MKTDIYSQVLYWLHNLPLTLSDALQIMAAHYQLLKQHGISGRKKEVNFPCHISGVTDIGKALAKRLDFSRDFCYTFVLQKSGGVLCCGQTTRHFTIQFI